MSENHDSLELVANGASRVILIRRGSFELHPGAVSYVQADDEERATVYVFTERLERARLIAQRGGP